MYPHTEFIRWLSISSLLLLALIAGMTQAQAPQVSFNVEQYQVVGESPLVAGEIDKILQPYTGEHKGLDGLLAAVDALEKALVEAGHPFYRVSLPQQTLTDGTVKLELVTFRLGEIKLSGNEFFSEQNIFRALPHLKADAVPEPAKVSEDMRLANQHPDRKIKVSFQDGQAAGSLDATVEVEDQRPWHLFATLNNTGTSQTGDYRLTMGFQHTNIADLDHQFTATYTMSPDKSEAVAQYGLNYLIPIYSQQMQLGLLFSDSDVDSGLVANAFDVKGKGKVLGATLTKYLPKMNTYTHAIDLSVMDQLFVSDVNFAGTPLGNDVRSRPLSFGYEGTYQQKEWQLGFHADLITNLPGGSHNNQTAYTAARASADTDWYKVNFGLNGYYFLQDQWMLQSRMEAQWANETLIPAEQFSLGGASSVRGFAESATSGDKGFYYNIELWTPPIAQGIRPYVFHDGGLRKLIDVQAGEEKVDRVSSLGLGASWQVSDALSIQADYAYILNGSGAANPAGADKLHINLLYRF